jgi:hypothetical protein
VLLDERFESMRAEISLAEQMRDYPLIQLGQVTDGPEILKFLETIEMKTSRLSLRYDRSPDFFAFSKVQAQRSFHFLFRNPNGEMCGLAVLSFRPMRIRNRIENVGYGSDLRVSPSASRKTRLQWRKLYSEFLRNLSRIPEFGGARIVLTSVFDENRSAISAFVDDKGRDLIYRPVFPYQSVNVFAKWPLPLLPKQEQRIATQSELFSLLCSNPEGSEIGFCRPELDRLQQFLPLKPQNFLSLSEPNGSLRACALPWSDQAWRRLKVDALPKAQQVLGQMLPLLGRPAVRLGESLRIQHLGFFKTTSETELEKIQDQVALLNQYWKQRKQAPLEERPHIISLRDRQNSSLTRSLKSAGYLFFVIPAHLYQVIHPENKTDENLLQLDGTRIPDFELGLA